MIIREAYKEELGILRDLFLRHIAEHPEYISHGEIQMGVGEAWLQDGEVVAQPSAEAERYWTQYIEDKYASCEAVILVALGEEGECGADGPVVGFSVVEITEDGADPFGMVCDLLVRAGCRGKGIGQRLLDEGLKWLRERGIRDVYLESGKYNHTAHEFFRRRGFVHVSEIFRLF